VGDAVIVADETVGFRDFDLRDPLGFVDGTANPVGPATPAAATSWCRSVHDLGDPAGLHGRLLDYSTPLTGCTFFAPSASLLASLDPEAD